MKLKFPENFKFGVSTSSYQIEGASNERGQSIWDVFSHKKNNIADGTNGDITCDHYHKFKEDIKTMKELGINSYRFSFSWPRIFPKGYGELNEKGLNFYKRLINELKKREIEPIATLYHWDLPQKLQEEGGWINKETAKHFENYARFMFKEFGNSIDKWITHNEPWVASFVGNAEGRHAPGLKDFKTAVQVSHNILYSHGLAVKAFRDENLKGEIGISLNLSPVYNESNDKELEHIKERYDQFLNKWFLDPLFKGKYPQDLFDFYKEKHGFNETSKEEMNLINLPIDFLGINYYTPTVLKKKTQKENNSLSTKADFSNQGYSSLDTSGFSSKEKNILMKWKANPRGLESLLKNIKKEYGEIPIYITENGFSFENPVKKELEINDKERINYFKDHLNILTKIINEGIPLKGYFAWSLLDNFEWSFGLSKRFGLIYVNFETQERIWKKSAHFYKNFINENS